MARRAQVGVSAIRRTAGGIADADGLFAMRIDRGPWMIVGVSPHGCDDAGRPGALAFHALFVDPVDLRAAGADPFAFADLLRRDWSPADLDATLPPGRSIIQRASLRSAVNPSLSDDEQQRLSAIVTALASGRRVAVQSAGPIDALAHDAWRALPLRVRLTGVRGDLGLR